MSSDSSMNLMEMALLVLVVANLAVSIYVASKAKHAAEEDYAMTDKRFGKDLNTR